MHIDVKFRWVIIFIFSLMYVSMYLSANAVLFSNVFFVLLTIISMKEFILRDLN